MTRIRQPGAVASVELWPRHPWSPPHHAGLWWWRLVFETADLVVPASRGARTHPARSHFAPPKHHQTCQSLSVGIAPQGSLAGYIRARSSVCSETCAVENRRVGRNRSVSDDARGGVRHDDREDGDVDAHHRDQWHLYGADTRVDAGPDGDGAGEGRLVADSQRPPGTKNEGHRDGLSRPRNRRRIQ